MASALSEGMAYRQNGSLRMLVPAQKGTNKYKMPLPFVAMPALGPHTDTQLFSPLVAFSLSGKRADPLEALATTHFDEHGATVALPMKAVFVALLLSTDKAIFDKFRREVYSPAFVKSVVAQLAAKYGLPLSTPDNWTPINAGMKGARKNKGTKKPVCQGCSTAGDAAVYEASSGLRLCKLCWEQSGAGRQRNYISKETIEKAASDDLDKVPTRGRAVRDVLLESYSDHLWDLLENVISGDRAFALKYNDNRARAHTILSHLHPESLPMTHPPRTWMILYKRNPARASSLARLKTDWVKAPSKLAQCAHGNLSLQAVCAAPKPKNTMHYPTVCDPTADPPQKATFETLFFVSGSHILVATAVWFANMLLVTKQISIEFVLEGPPLQPGDPGFNNDDAATAEIVKGVDPFVTVGVCGDDGLAVITHGDRISYPYLHRLVVESFRCSRLKSIRTIQFRIHVSWAAARQNTHVGKLVVGPAASHMIAYALNLAADRALPSNMALSFGETLNPLLYDTARAQALQTEAKVITDCVLAAEGAKDGLGAFIGKGDQMQEITFDDFADYVQRYPAQTTPPDVHDILPPYAEGSKKETTERVTPSQSAADRVSKRRNSIFGAP